jgi:hypothetical protein
MLFTHAAHAAAKTVAAFITFTITGAALTSQSKWTAGPHLAVSSLATPQYFNALTAHS